MITVTLAATYAWKQTHISVFIFVTYLAIHRGLEGYCRALLDVLHPINYVCCCCILDPDIGLTNSSSTSFKQLISLVYR